MATIRKRGLKWQAQVCKLGIRRSETFATKSKAKAWAIQIESEIVAGQLAAVSSDLRVSQRIDKYIQTSIYDKRNPNKVYCEPKYSAENPPVFWSKHR